MKYILLVGLVSLMIQKGYSQCPENDLNASIYRYQLSDESSPGFGDGTIEIYLTGLNANQAWKASLFVDNTFEVVATTVSDRNIVRFDNTTKGPLGLSTAKIHSNNYVVAISALDDAETDCPPYALLHFSVGKSSAVSTNNSTENKE